MENFHKYPKILAIGHEDIKELLSDPDDEIVIQEKIDGANFRFMIKDGKVIFGSRTQQITDDEGNDANVAKNFKSVCDYVRDRVASVKDIMPDSVSGCIFYGEACFRHTMPYNWETIPRLLGFDVFYIPENRFLNATEVRTCFGNFRISVVPEVGVLKASDIKEIKDSMVPKAFYFSPSSPDQQAEGIVFKNYKKQLFGKYVRDKFKEANAETFGGNPKYNKVDDTNNAEFVFKYCTNARIDKIIFKLVDAGDKLDMPLMQKLPKMIYMDIFDEHWQEIRDSNWKLDFKQLRCLIPKRCVAVLKQVITNNAISTLSTAGPTAVG